MDKYIGDRKIITMAVSKSVTPAGKEMVDLTYDDGSSETMAKNKFDVIVTDDKSDLSTISTKIQQHVASFIFGIFHEFDLKFGDIGKTCDYALDLVNNAYHKATDELWGYDNLSIPMIKINNLVEQSNARTKDSNGTSSEGGGTNTQDTK